MKCTLLLAALAAPMLASGAMFVSSRTVATRDNPIPKVLTLLEDLKAKIEADAESEQAEYDKFACWCEDTLGQKATDISDAKEHIEELETLVVKLSGDIGVHTAEIAQLEKDIAQNIQATKEATEVRDQGVKEYEEEKAESEQCIGALEAAIKVLAGAGATQKGFLETLHEAQLLSVAADVKQVLKIPAASRSVTDKQITVVQQFISHPEDFVRGRSGNFMSAAQIAQNPYGDYAPQSTQIQGILKTMYGDFAKGLEKANTEEAEKQKAYEELMATKKKELETLEATLEKQKGEHASKTKELADSEKDLDDTKAQLKADEEFFATTKQSCSDKAAMWSQRTRLRTEELHGIAQAVEILSSEDATKVFENATSTFFLQMASRSVQHESDVNNKAYTKLSALATKFQNVEIARFAVQAKTAGHFDAIISAIDQMIARLREQEGQDIKERDWCNENLYKNKIDIEDLEHNIELAEKGVERLTDEIADLKVDHLKEELNATADEIEELKALRADERAHFIQSIKDDDDAIALLDKAIAALSKYYSFAQGIKHASKQDPPPETSFQTGDYTGKEEATKGIVSILSMIKEDLQKEMLTARNGDAQAQVQYESDLGGLNKVMSALAAKITEILTLKAKKEEEMALLEKKKEALGVDLEAEEKVKEALEAKCAWVESHFDSRRTSRKAEIQGLVEAKNFLAGVE